MLTYNSMKKRADIVCFDKNGQAIIIVNVASSVKVSQAVFEQSSI